MSHCFIMQTPAYPRPFVITDAALNIAPTLKDKADIIRNAVDLVHAFGIERPHVAILAAVETVNPSMPATLDAAALCKMADRGQIGGAVLDGPLAFDNAVSAAAARSSRPTRNGLRRLTPRAFFTEAWRRARAPGFERKSHQANECSDAGRIRTKHRLFPYL
jgi:hypothetical protein